MKHLKWAALPLGLLMSAGAFAGGLNMQPGLWQMTMKVTMTGLPMMSGPKTSTVKECLTRAKLRDPWKSMQSNKRANCKFSNVSVTSDRASFSMKCTGQAPTEGHGTIIVDSPTHMHEQLDQISHYGGMTIKIHAEGTGHRLGSCDSSK